MDDTETIGKNQSVDVGGSRTITVQGSNASISASSISLTASQISLNAPMVTSARPLLKKKILS